MEFKPPEPPVNPSDSSKPIMTGTSIIPQSIHPSKLDNPPRTRTPGTPAGGAVALNPFAGIPAIDLINMKEALASRLETLRADSAGENLDHVTSTARMLALVSAKLFPKPVGEGLLLSVPAAPGVKPMLPVKPPELPTADNF